MLEYGFSLTPSIAFLALVGGVAITGIVGVSALGQYGDSMWDYMISVDVQGRLIAAVGAITSRFDILSAAVASQTLPEETLAPDRPLNPGEAVTVYFKAYSFADEKAISITRAIRRTDWPEPPPTVGSSRTLKLNLGGYIGDGLWAHHMIPSRQAGAADARTALYNCCIGINDAMNGIQMTMAAHQKTLGGAYANWITNLVKNLTHCFELFLTLIEVENVLASGTTPWNPLSC
jgi:hypothetical protein